MPDEKAIDTENINYTTKNYSSGEDEETTSSTDSETSENIEDNNEPPIEIKEEFVKPKKSILLKILFGIIGLLFLLLIIGAVLYFTGFFQPKEIKQIEKPIEEQTVQKIEPAQDTYKFDIKDINSKKLNEQLANLTNANLNSDKIEELEKKANEEKLIAEQKQKEDELLKQKEDELLKQKTELEEKKQELEKQKAQLEAMKQEALKLKEELSNTKDPHVQEAITSIEEKITPNDSSKVRINPDENKIEDSNDNSVKVASKNEFLMLINVAKIKGVLYKKYLDKLTKINPTIKLCRDDQNRIELYYGPFEKNEDRTELLNKLVNNKFNEAYELELTQDEYNKRCNY
jgi:hypothetical protein